MFSGPYLTNGSTQLVTIPDPHAVLVTAWTIRPAVCPTLTLFESAVVTLQYSMVSLPPYGKQVIQVHLFGFVGLALGFEETQLQVQERIDSRVFCLEVDQLSYHCLFFIRYTVQTIFYNLHGLVDACVSRSGSPEFHRRPGQMKCLFWVWAYLWQLNGIPDARDIFGKVKYMREKYNKRKKIYRIFFL